MQTSLLIVCMQAALRYRNLVHPCMHQGQMLCPIVKLLNWPVMSMVCGCLSAWAVYSQVCSPVLSHQQPVMFHKLERVVPAGDVMAPYCKLDHAPGVTTDAH